MRTRAPAGIATDERAAQSWPSTLTRPEPRTGSIGSVTSASLPVIASVRDGAPDRPGGDYEEPPQHEEEEQRRRGGTPT
jgi:hypothetical protein